MNETRGMAFLRGGPWMQTLTEWTEQTAAMLSPKPDPRCSYCRATVDADRCRNCGAPR